MTQESTASGLPLEVQLQMDLILRSSAYTGLREIQVWLASLGFDCPRSTIYQYALALRSLDAAAGNIPAMMLEHSHAGRRQREMSGCEPAGPRAEIVEELLAWGARTIGLFGPLPSFAS